MTVVVIAWTPPNGTPREDISKNRREKNKLLGYFNAQALLTKVHNPVVHIKTLSCESEMTLRIWVTFKQSYTIVVLARTHIDYCSNMPVHA